MHSYSYSYSPRLEPGMLRARFALFLARLVGFLAYSSILTDFTKSPNFNINRGKLK